MMKTLMLNIFEKPECPMAVQVPEATYERFKHFQDKTMLEKNVEEIMIHARQNMAIRVKRKTKTILVFVDGSGVEFMVSDAAWDRFTHLHGSSVSHETPDLIMEWDRENEDLKNREDRMVDSKQVAKSLFS